PPGLVSQRAYRVAASLVDFQRQDPTGLEQRRGAREQRARRGESIGAADQGVARLELLDRRRQRGVFVLGQIGRIRDDGPVALPRERREQVSLPNLDWSTGAHQ